MLALRRPSALLSLNRTAVRFTHKTRQKKVPVQLLKDVEGLGVRGEIVQVKPIHMLNWLQFKGRAAFILPGQSPTIPVVDRSKQMKELENEKRKLAQQKSEEKKLQDIAAKKTQLSDLESISGLNFGNEQPSSSS